MQATFSRLYICNTACISPIYVHSKWISCGLGIQSFNASLSVSDKPCTIYMMIFQYSTSILSDNKEGRRKVSSWTSFLETHDKSLCYYSMFINSSEDLLGWRWWHAGREIVRGVARSRNTCGGLLLQHPH